ncbi:uncharacterized protein [Argopecten irradians]|uniref:uncharacterized protein n=1 Tax=Argopecten irradians TaxID=31199 RepID=UPI00371750E2
MTLDSHFLNLKCAVVPATETKILMPRGSTFQMRVRRRQSDAKWRASVATCYETLKNIIPNRDKMPKRKISKALILQETENHIVNIENKFRDLLEEKAKAKGKSLVMQTEYGFVEAKLEDIRKEFSVKQENLYLQNCSQRKKSNIPSDLELGLIDLRSSMCNLSVVPSDCLQEFLNSSNSNDFCETLNKETSREDTKPSENLSSEASTESLRGRVENLKVQQDLDVAAECPTLPPRTPVKSRRGRPSTRRQMGQYRFERVVSPEHSNISENCSSFTSENFHRGQHDVPFECNSFHRRDKTPSQTRKRGHDSSSRSRTPARSTKQASLWVCKVLPGYKGVLV